MVYTFFAFGRLGLELSVPVSVILGLSLYAASQTAEIIRAGVLGRARQRGGPGLRAHRAPDLPRHRPAPGGPPHGAGPGEPVVTLTKSTSCGAVIGLHEVLRRGVII